MKQLYIFLLLVLSCSTAVAQRALFDFTKIWTQKNSKYTYGEDTITVSGGKNGVSMNDYSSRDVCRHASIRNSGEYIQLPAFDFVVKNIEVVGMQGGNQKAELTIYVKSHAASAAQVGSSAGTDEHALTHVFAINAEDQEIGTIYKIQNTNGKNFPLTIIKVYGDTKEITLADFQNNTTTIEDAQAQKVNATLTRTFDNDGWYTVCLPFATTASAFGDGAKVLEYDNTSDGTVMNFKSTTALEAGKPYLVLPSQRMENPTFDDVTITATEPTAVGSDYKFVGTFSPIQLSTTTDLFLGADNTLYRPSATSSAMKGFRAYFQMPSNASAKPSILADGVTLSISDIRDITPADGRIYTLQGQFVGTSKSALPAGLYIMNGRKVVIRK